MGPWARPWDISKVIMASCSPVGHSHPSGGLAPLGASPTVTKPPRRQLPWREASLAQLLGLTGKIPQGRSQVLQLTDYVPFSHKQCIIWPGR